MHLSKKKQTHRSLCTLKKIPKISSFDYWNEGRENETQRRRGWYGSETHLVSQALRVEVIRQHWLSNR